MVIRHNRPMGLRIYAALLLAASLAVAPAVLAQNAPAPAANPGAATATPPATAPVPVPVPQGGPQAPIVAQPLPAPAPAAPPPATATPSPAIPSPAAPVVPPAAPPVTGAPASSPPVIVNPAPPAGTVPSGDAAQAIDVKARPVAVLRGTASWDDGYRVILDAMAKVKRETEKAGLVATGRPLTAFVDTDDNGFKFEAMLPLAEAPEGKTSLSADVKLGASPSGKALKFQHRGAYDDIDSTYEAITAYLDEKGLEAQNIFVEEYLNDPKGADDTALAVDIYVFIK